MPEIPRHIAAVLSALRFRSPNSNSLRSFDDSGWNEVLSYCDLMHLTLPLVDVCGDAAPSWVRTRITQNLADNAKRFERIKAAYQEFSEAFQSAGVEFIVLKGFAQYPDYADHPRLRLQSDIDLFCPPDSLYRARDILLALNYRPSKMSVPGDHLPSMSRNAGWQWRGNFYDPELPPSVDLHYELWDKARARFGPSCLDDFWERRVVRRVDNLTFPTLHWVDNLGFSAIQVLRDLLYRALFTHKVYELGRFLHRNALNAEFWNDWRELHDDSLRSYEAVSFRLAVQWFDCEVAPEVQQEIARLPTAIEKWFASYTGSSLNPLCEATNDPLWLHWALVESARDKSAIFLQSFLPTSTPTLETLEVRDTTLDGRARSHWLSARPLRYLAYCLSRIASRVRVLVPTLWHGICYWSSLKGRS